MKLDKQIKEFLEKNPHLKLNTDPLHVNTIKKGLRYNKDVHGEYFCTCKVHKVSDNICYCKEVIETNKCHCKLFVEV